MIEESDYKFPHAEPKHERTPEEQRQADETLDYLEALDWQPFGVEW